MWKLLKICHQLLNCHINLEIIVGNVKSFFPKTKIYCSVINKFIKDSDIATVAILVRPDPSSSGSFSD